MLHTNNPVIKHKAGLHNLAGESGNASKACKIMGVSRDTFYRYQNWLNKAALMRWLIKAEGFPTWRIVLMRPRNARLWSTLLSSRRMGSTGPAINCVKKACLSPAATCAPSGNGTTRRTSVIAWRHLRKKLLGKALCLPMLKLLHWRRMRTTTKQAVKSELITRVIWGHRTPSVLAIWKARERIYQQTFVDTYSKVAHCKLHTSKTPITAAGLLNDRVLSFYKAEGLPVLEILTDRRTEYWGRVEQHDYQLYLVINDIDHTKMKAMCPQTNVICGRFHKTILQDFYQVTFCTKLYADLESLQPEPDNWLWQGAPYRRLEET